jgi:hypothetical protein
VGTVVGGGCVEMVMVVDGCGGVVIDARVEIDVYFTIGNVVIGWWADRVVGSGDRMEYCAQGDIVGDV